VWAAALAIESSDRVDALAFPAIRIDADAVGDVAHLLAELLDNAVRVSAPGGRVTVLGTVAADGGFDLSVIDTGHGLPAVELATANRRVRRVDPLERVPTSGIGLDVVGRLARRHDVVVEFGTATSGGIAAMVHLPPAILTAETDDAFEPGAFPDAGAGVEAPAAEVVDAVIDDEAVTDTLATGEVAADDVAADEVAADAVVVDEVAGEAVADVVHSDEVLADAVHTREALADEAVVEAGPTVAPTPVGAVRSGVLDLVAEERPGRVDLPTRPEADDLLPRRQPKWAAAIAARSRD
jgi:anti-sigma regulatory factor (Ser/Thr protein kinase)